ncbi:trypsin-like peptidase domain-containing protein [Seohaeicola nanhaiensis]|uniref:Trypsin-like peptidase domain-containing protein n=1 Tax=Seohaeicola nanhaiensis TaxID=1387282 RepID=A0ABV9KDH0_9RHOB
MKNLIAAVMVLLALTATSASAQTGDDVVWVQIEAHPSLRVAQERAQLYSSVLADVNGFALGGSWYGIVLGPYSRADADRVLQVYRSQQQIPQDSFIAYTRNFGQQYWPVGANALAQTPVTPPTEAPVAESATPTPVTEAPVAEAPVAETPAPQPEPTVAVQLPERDLESPAEARRSEAALSADERKALQIALAAAGFYNSSIDGAFGAGTRRSMGEWQAFNGLEATGVLTTRQRQMLMDQYNAPLISVGMAPHTDAQAGISIDMPMGEVTFSRYEPPFAHYDAKGDLGARVLLISQPGDRNTLYGLYDIMQTLEIVPLNGPREKSGDSFTLEGRGSKIVSYTQASLQNGEIKGFTLIWPTGDEERRARVLAAMKASFARTTGVLDPAAGADSEQHIDLVSGLEVRRPKMSRSGFYIDSKGTIVTTLEGVQQCGRITVEQDHRAEIVAQDSTLGVAVLRPTDPLAPIAVAKLREDTLRLQSEVTVSGYSYEGVLGGPTLTFGTLADIKGLNGEPELQRLALAALPGDAGGPVIDISGGVIGMLLPPPAGNRVLPENVSLAADASALKTLLATAGVTPTESTDRGAISPDEMNRLADGMTVLVSCWE